MISKFDKAKALVFLQETVQLVAGGSKEGPLRHNLSAHLPRMFPDVPWWIKAHATGAETFARFNKAGRSAHGFVDTLVGATAIEYESDLRVEQKFVTGLGQVKDYCANLLNAGHPQHLIVGVLSDTVRWRAYRVSKVLDITAVSGATVLGRDHLELDEIDACDLEAAGEPEAIVLGQFLDKHLGRRGARLLSASTLSYDLGFASSFSRHHVVGILTLISDAFTADPKYAALIRNLWDGFVSYLGGAAPSGTFSQRVYADELYVLTLAKLICANLISEKALVSDDTELAEILDGVFFENRGLANFVEYDYFGWLNTAPHAQALLPVARGIQEDLLAYDFTSAPAEDLFGELMSQLASRSQRLLLGQEWTPSWLAEKIVTNTLSKLADGTDAKFVDMCCGSGAMVVEVIKQVKGRLKADGVSPESPEAIVALADSITGFDIDPLAVMLAKVNWVIAAKEWLDPAQPVAIPIYHADSLFSATPLAKSTDKSGAEHHELLLDGLMIELPAFLVSPKRASLFEKILASAYDVAMASAKAPPAKKAPAFVPDMVDAAISGSPSALEGDERKRLIVFTDALMDVLEQLQRTGRNGIWSFILRNSYRPGLVSGNFNGLVSNPPWLALSKIANNPYTEDLRERSKQFGIAPPGPAHLHVEMATIFLLNAVDRYLTDGSVLGCILPDAVLSAHHHSPFREGAYAHAKRSVNLRVDELWRIERGAFKNEAIVLFGTKAAPMSGNISGRDVSRTGNTAVVFKRIAKGARTAWSDRPAVGNVSAGSFKPANFRQGADVMPRTVIFHAAVKNAAGSWNLSPITVTSKECYLKAAPKVLKGFSLTVNGVSDKLIVDVLMSHHLTPFDIGDGAKGLLPIEKNGAWQPLALPDISALGKPSKNAVNKVLSALGAGATPQTMFQYFDTNRKKLTSQVWSDGWLVLMGAGGSNVCAAFAPAARFATDKTVIDQTLYWARVGSEDEAVYLTGLLNSSAVNEVIKEFQSRGLFGERHIHKLPIEMTPPFDSGEPSHMEVVRTTRKVMSEWAVYKSANGATIDPLLRPGSPLGRRRPAITKIISALPSWNDYVDACKAVYCVP
ncbi:N-6 DNA methylase [Lysobacter sp. A286]